MNIIDKIAIEWRKYKKMYRDDIIGNDEFVSYYYDLRNTLQCLSKCNLITDEEKNKSISMLCFQLLALLNHS